MENNTNDGEEYYTPDISEFHVGFEYEYLCHFGENKGRWVKEKVDRNASFELCNDLVEMLHVRVKYLDEDDIKEFGFEFNPNHGFQWDCSSDGFLQKKSTGTLNLYEGLIVSLRKYIDIGYDGATLISVDSKSINITLFKTNKMVNVGVIEENSILNKNSIGFEQQYDTVFNGIIKNKSELKKVLQMLRLTI